MTTIYDTRRQNFLTLLEGDTRTQEEIATDLGMPGQYSVSLFRSGSRNIGDTWARRIEAKFGLEVGWMDTPHHPDERAAAPQAATSHAQNGHTIMPPEVELIAALYSRVPPDVQSRVRSLLTSPPRPSAPPESADAKPAPTRSAQAVQSPVSHGARDYSPAKRSRRGS
jgi:hypothetical protein